MAVCKFNFFYNHRNIEAFSLLRFYQKTRIRNIVFRNYCNSKDNSVAAASNEIKNILQPIPRKNRKLSVIDEKDKELAESIKERKNPYYPYEDLYDKFTTVLGDGFKEVSKRVVKLVTGVQLNFEERPFYPLHMDIVIIGCNAIGLSIAFAMKERFPETPSILVIDKDSQFPKGSTNIGQSMLMQQLFTDEEEIAMNKYAAEFLSSFPRLTEIEELPRFKLPYEPLGSLLLADETNYQELTKKIEILNKNGIVTKVLSAKALKMQFPWLNLKNVLFGSLGMKNEGMYDPWSFFIGLKYKAAKLGVQFMTAEALDFAVDKHKIPTRVLCKLDNGNYHAIDFAKCVIAAGVESLNLLEILNSANLGPFNVQLPLEERMRYEYCFYCPEGPGLDTPIVVDSDGTYFRREGLCSHYVAGVPCVPRGDGDDFGPYDVFINKVKPFLAKRVPQFEQLNLVKGWFDSYDFCASNEVGVLGFHPNDGRIVLALGFSHLGLQHAPAVGRAVMELIAYDDYQTIDLSRYHVENLWQKQHLEAARKRQESLESRERIVISD